MGERIDEAKKGAGELAKKVRGNAEKIAAVSALAAVALLASGCDVVPQDHSQEVITHNIGQARRTALTKYRHGLKRISPSGKFAMQYLGEWDADVVKTKKSDEKNENWQIEDFYRFQINNACLRGTAYDIAGGNFKVSAQADGFFSYSHADAQGSVPTAAANAYVDFKHPDRLMIESGSSSRDLYFDGAQGVGPLIPVGDVTKSVLFTTNQCDTGLVRHATIDVANDGYHTIEPQHTIYPAPTQ